MGALVAFEVARALRREGFPPARLLVASARVAPQCTAAAGPVAHLPDQELAEVMEARSGGMPPEVLADRETLALFMPVLRCDMRLLEQYQYQEEATLDTPLLALAGEDDPLTTLAQAHAWREQTSASFEVERFCGDHWFIRMHTASIARSILRRLTSSGMGRSHTTDSRSQTGG
jgi:surfactin synthase thioesterase subunit